MSLPSQDLASSGASPSAVTCLGVTKAFGSVRAVDGVDLQIPSGEILALLGPSGCGKTTLLRLIAGFEQPDDGRILLAGTEVAAPGRCVPPERRRTGVVFQDYALFPHMTVRQNVGYGLPRSQRRSGKRVGEVLDLVRLGSLSGRYPHELSGGQQQRVALARALAPDPAIVLLDEPFSGLDAALRDQVRTEVREILQAAGATAIVVTHDQEEALSLADRIAVMRSGRLHQIDTPDRLYTRPADLFVASFVGGANILPAVSNGQVVSCSLGELHPADVPAPGDALVVLRPESLRLRADVSGTGVVHRATYYGHDQMIEVGLQDGTVVRSRLGPGRFFEPGDRVSLTVVGDEMLVFATPGA